MKRLWFLAALLVGGCEQSGVAQQTHSGGPEAWERHALAASGVSAEMPCPAGQLQTHLFPVDEQEQIGCLQDGAVFGLMRDPRAFVEIQQEITGDGRYTVEPASLSNGRRGILIARSDGAERQLVVDLQNGETAWAIYREMPNSAQTGDRTRVDRFFDSIEMTAI